MIKVTRSTNPTKNARNGLSLTPGNLGGNVTINATIQINAIVKETCPLATSPMTDKISGATRRYRSQPRYWCNDIHTTNKLSISITIVGTVFQRYMVICCDARMGTRTAPTSRSAKARDIRRKFETTLSDLLLQITAIVREFPTVPNRNKIFHT